jgi:uncharacterized protein (DUF3820 family)
MVEGTGLNLFGQKNSWYGIANMAEWTQMDTSMIPYGKYAGHSISEIEKKDFNYLVWLRETDPFWIERIKDFLPVNDYRIPFGKYKGALVSQVKSEDPRYIEWLAQNVDEPLFQKALISS